MNTAIHLITTLNMLQSLHIRTTKLHKQKKHCLLIKMSLLKFYMCDNIITNKR